MAGGMAEFKQASNRHFDKMRWCIAVDEGRRQSVTYAAMLGLFARLDRIAMLIDGDGFKAVSGTDDDCLGGDKSQSHKASRDLGNQKPHEQADKQDETWGKSCHEFVLAVTKTGRNKFKCKYLDKLHSDTSRNCVISSISAQRQIGQSVKRRFWEANGEYKQKLLGMARMRRELSVVK